MPDPTRTRTLSIYLLKDGVEGNAALTDDHHLGDPIADATIPTGSTLYLFDGAEREPWWKQYFGVARPLKQSSKAALLFLPAGGRTYALCFGHVAHNLRDDAYEYDFGLRITLNCVDPTKLKNTDVVEPGAARRQRTQVSVDSDLTYFDFETDATVLRSLTGAVKNEHAGLIKNVTGSSNLRIATKTRVEDLPRLCEKLFALYTSDDYKASFPEVQNVTPVKDPQQVAMLDEILIGKLKDRSDEPMLAIPELVEYNDSFWVSFAGVGKSSLHHDVFLARYYDYLESNGTSVATLDREALDRHHLVILNDDETPRTRFRIYKSLIFTASLPAAGATFHLMEGNWFRFDDDYIARLNKELGRALETSILPSSKRNLEGEYNIDVAAEMPNAVLLDKKNMSPSGQTQVEPCDVLVKIDGLAVFVHVKFSTASAQLSHLFNQGSNAMQLLRSIDEVRPKLEALVRKEASAPEVAEDLIALIDRNNIKVHYAIVTHKKPDGGVENLPLFSRMSLRRSLATFKSMSVPVTFAFVPNEAPDRKPTKKTRKKKAGESS
ncbi:DUF6119 family protein [Leifsonia sp. Le1]|uniref:DUF6119 family protein n=1 Tax=Leifsonia sp. Le1 TaxID=3404918 RepID=UPI003EB7763C